MLNISSIDIRYICIMIYRLGQQQRTNIEANLECCLDFVLEEPKGPAGIRTQDLLFTRQAL